MLNILDSAQQQIINQCRDYIEQMDFVPLTDAELLDVQNNKAQAIDNNRMEGLYQDDLAILLGDLFIEYRLPPKNRIDLLLAVYSENND